MRPGRSSAGWRWLPRRPGRAAGRCDAWRAHWFWMCDAWVVSWSGGWKELAGFLLPGVLRWILRQVAEPDMLARDLARSDGGHGPTTRSSTQWPSCSRLTEDRPTTAFVLSDLFGAQLRGRLAKRFGRDLKLVLVNKIPGSLAAQNVNHH